eukprot:TRINITY_DN4913_c3_g1_i1.p1 TRINITY_DN4913_c3_g1~~TRINITY_DN4913_c3_g1_i1.p1  ORF type:complete len:1080 (+),score=411.10 TRINITY_DN4913_c3_g1_i1:109-3240(+)
MSYAPLARDLSEAEYEEDKLGAVSGLWKSEDMCLISLKCEMPLIERLLRRLGQVGFAEFRDVSEAEGDAAHRKGAEYKDKVRACENVERRLRYFEELYRRFPLGNTGYFVRQNQDTWAVKGGTAGWKPGALGVPSFEDQSNWEDGADALATLDRRVEAEEGALKEEHIRNIESNIGDYCTLLEQIALLNSLKTRELHMDAEAARLHASGRRQSDTPRVEAEARRYGEDVQAMRGFGASAPASNQFGFLVGAVEADRVQRFRSLVERVSKRNAVIVTTDPEEILSMNLHDEHQLCVRDCAQQPGSLATPDEDGCVDVLRDLDEGERVSEKLCGFLIYYSSPVVQQRLIKLCASWGGRLHFANPLPAAGTSEKPEEICKRLQVEWLNTQLYDGLIAEKRRTATEKLGMTSKLVDVVVRDLARLQSHHAARRRYVLTEKALYHAVSTMKIRGDGVGELKVEAQCWVPRRKRRLVEGHIKDVLRGHASYVADIPIDEVPETPPTWFDTNVFTETFQGIVDSYGVPRYHETNPAIWTVITFPWLFGIMYGDIGHGIMIFISAALMIAFEKKFIGQQLNEIVEMIFGARYLLLLMGLFATYIGFLYNDTFGLMLEYSPSRFLFPDEWEHFKHKEAPWDKPPLNNSDPVFVDKWDGMVPPVCQRCAPGDFKERTDIPIYDWMGHAITNVTAVLSCPYDYTGDTKYSCFTPKGWGQSNSPKPFAMMSPNDGPTPFGMDSGWSEADNKLDFLNSFKMKNAIIVGVVQMMLGLFLSLCNYLQRRDIKRIFFSFLPEIVFLSCTFGYMAVMIVMKWTTQWDSTNVSPNTLETMTNFFLSPGHYPEFDERKCHDSTHPDFPDCAGYAVLFDGQPGVQVVLFAIAFASLPFMLIPIPFFEWRRKQALSDSPSPADQAAAAKIDMQEVVIKQVIHVIEYVLGCVSNTASYLRLWALSLAHAELSEVFLEYTFMTFVEQDSTKGFGGGIMMYIAFGAWLSATIGVLIVMEALSAFLHSLRLHWVEFQNKFYVGDGRAFKPLSFRNVLEEHGVSAEVSM